MPMPTSQVLLLAADQQNVKTVATLLERDPRLAVQLEPVQTLAGGLARLTQAHPISLVLLELNLPDSQGLETFHQLRSQCPQVPLIILIEPSDEALALTALQEGAWDYLIKGQFDRSLLTRTIRYALECQHHTLALEEKTLSLQLLARQLAAAQQKLEQLATVDELTQVHTRCHFDALLLEEWHRLSREQAPLSLIIGNVNRLNTFNHTFGRAAGDQCLQQIARILLRLVKRPADRVARYSGQQFAILLPNTDMTGATHVANLIQTELGALELPPISAQGDCISLSLGIASRIPSEDIAPSLLLEEVKSNLHPPPQLEKEPNFIGQTRQVGEAIRMSQLAYSYSF